MRLRLTAAVLAVLLLPAAGLAQNREHLQMTADLRILQEHVNRLQLAVNRLDQDLAATRKRLEEVSAASVKGFADQQLLINQLSQTLTSVRERIDDNSVRVSQLGQEFTAIREGLRLLTDQINTLVQLLQPTLPEAQRPAAQAAPSTPAGSADAGTPGEPAPSALDPVIIPQSATAIFQSAYGDYLAGRYDSAIEGFRELIQQYPDSPDAAAAQFWVAQSFNLKKDCRSAVPEYRRFVENYRSADDRDEGLYMLGWCYNDIGQRADAQHTYEQLIAEYPDSTWAIMARQRLEGMGVKPPQ